MGLLPRDGGEAGDDGSQIHRGLLCRGPQCHPWVGPGGSAPAEGLQGLRETQQGLREVHWALREQMGQLAREQRALVKLLRGELRRSRRGQIGQPRARRPAAEQRTCYACLRQGHLKWDCPYWDGGRGESRRQTAG
uniref:CCHC-type domain-containing protein n=1 Tax=Chrysemys picta bellii TaxID=8478 RepID=A0A8C3FFK4_CHRPI